MSEKARIALWKYDREEKLCLCGQGNVEWVYQIGEEKKYACDECKRNYQRYVEYLKKYVDFEMK